MEIAAGTLIGRYEVQGPLAAGGMGKVYVARDVKLKRPVALKLLPANIAADPSLLGRFRREAQAVLALNHPHVVTVYDAGEADGLLYLAMQFVAGTDLRRLLEMEGPLEPSRALNVLAQVAGALDAAHAHGLVHRDVKPANVLVDVDRAYLGDFGLTKRFDATGGMTGVGQIIEDRHEGQTPRTNA